MPLQSESKAGILYTNEKREKKSEAFFFHDCGEKTTLHNYGASKIASWCPELCPKCKEPITIPIMYGVEKEQ